MHVGGLEGCYRSPLGKKCGNSQMLHLFSEAIPSAEFLSCLSRAQFLDKESQIIKPFNGVKEFALDDIWFLKLLISQCCHKQVGVTQGMPHLWHQKETPVSPAPSRLLVSSKNCPILCQYFPLVQDKTPALFNEEQDVKQLQQFLSCILKVRLFKNCHPVGKAIMWTVWSTTGFKVTRVPDN